MKAIEEYVRCIPDFPKEGIMFRDITTVIQDPEGFKLAIDLLKERLEGVDFDAFACIEARGFIFGSALAYSLGKGVVTIRKKGKLPCETVEYNYDLEYGTSTLEIHKDALKAGDRVIVIDDLLATGGSLEAASKLVEMLGAKVEMLLTLIELKGLEGRKKLKDYRVESIISYEGK